MRASGRGRERSARLGAPFLAPGAAALLAALALWAGWGRLASCGASLEAPDAQVRRALAHQERAHLDDVYGFRSGGVIELNPVRFSDVVVQAGDGRAEVLAVVEAEGRAVWRDQAARLAYVGRERFAMTPCPIALWCGDGQQFSRLRGVLMTLFRRQDALGGRDLGAYARVVSDAYAGDGGKAALLARLRADLAAGPPARLRVHAWQIRVDRDRATVGEDYEIQVGDAAPRKLRARFELALEDGRWTIVSGL